ncbi:MAG: hypothetical protein OXD50_05920 [Chloroflexi bacterium]|nr:hypothetical protein [Chloroflexota bacterium]
MFGNRFFIERCRGNEIEGGALLVSLRGMRTTVSALDDGALSGDCSWQLKLRFDYFAILIENRS